jgi:hypothetical protein
MPECFSLCKYDNHRIVLRRVYISVDVYSEGAVDAMIFVLNARIR